MKTAMAARPLGQMPRWAKIALAAAAAPLFLVALGVAPVSLPPYLDFQVLYHTDMGLLRGIAIYDHAAQVRMIAQLAGVTPSQVNLLPFPYPPWYALSTLWLAWLPIEAAVRVWFGINLLLLFASIALLTEGWPLAKRVAAFLLGFFFLPVLGSLIVGQYGFPLLLGAALMVHALRHERPILVAAAAALLTFKPHLGALLVIGVLIHLWLRKDEFGKHAAAYLLVAAALLFGSGFLADRAWPIDYLHSLLSFQQNAGVASCDLCAGFPALAATRLGAAQGLEVALGIGAFVLLAMAVLWGRLRRPTLGQPLTLLAMTSLVVLLASPYLLNYDFILLLVPLACLAGQKHTLTGWLLLCITYLLPFAAVGVLGRQGNIVFPVCAALLTGMLYWNSRPLDVSPGTA